MSNRAARYGAYLEQRARGRTAPSAPGGAGRKLRQTALVTLALYLLLLAALGLRLIGLAAQDLWGDEAFTAWLAQRPLAGILRDLAQGEPHPPLYPLLVWAWVKLAGNGEFALRYASALFGVAVVALLGVIGRELQGRRLALVAALIATVNPFLVWYSQESRMYVVVAAFAAWAAAALLRGLSGGRRSWVAFAFAATLMIYAHYYGLLVLAGFTLVIVAALLRRKLPVRPWLGALALVAVLYLPWVAYASRIFFSYYGVAPGRIDLWGIFGGFWLHSALGLAAEPGDERRWLPIFLLLMLLGVAGAWRAAQRPPAPAPRWRVAVLLAWLLLPLVGGLLVSTVRPMYAERYLIVSTLPFLLLVAWGIGALRRRWPLQGLALLLVLMASFAPLRGQLFDQRFVKSEYSQHTDQVEALAQPRDFVILDAPSQGFLFNYYYKGALSHVGLPRDVPLDEAATAAELRLLTDRHSGVWLFLYATHDYDPGDFVEKWLSNHAFRAWHTWTINGRLVYYASHREERLVPRPGTARFGDQLELRRFATRAEPYAAGEVIPLLLTWRASAAPDKDFKVSLRLRDSAGFLWGQTDAEPVSGFRPTRTWPAGEEVQDRLGLLILPGTPPGRYSLELRVYPPGGQPVPVTSENLIAESTALTLDEVVVASAGRTVTGIGIPAFRPVGARFGDQIALEGESGTGEITAGESGYLTVLWRALAKPADDYEALLHLIDGRGSAAAEILLPPVNGETGTAQWAAGDVFRWQQNLRVPAKTPPGEYRLLLSLRPSGGPPLPVSAQPGLRPAIVGDAVELRRIVVKPRPRQSAGSTPQVALGARLGEKVALRGYSLGPDPTTPGAKIALTLYWESLAESEVSYTVFTHLLDGSGKIWAQQDAPPCGGGCPTTTWLPGDVVEDRYELAIRPDAPAGAYQIELGMYDLATGHRLPIVDGDGQPAGDRILLPKVGVGWQE